MQNSLDKLTDICNNACKDQGTLSSLIGTSNFDLKLDPNDYKHLICYSNTSFKKILIKSSDNVDIYLICWKKGQNSQIHDHPRKGCLMELYEGSLQEDKYNHDKSSDQITFIKSSILLPGQVYYTFGCDTLHRIIPLQDTISLHVYHKGYVPKYYH